MSTHNICFRREIRNIFTGYPPLSRSMTICTQIIQKDSLSNSLDPDPSDQACQFGLHYLSHIKNFLHGKYPKISNTKVSDKMTFANSADPEQ